MTNDLTHRELNEEIRETVKEMQSPQKQADRSAKEQQTRAITHRVQRLGL